MENYESLGMIGEGTYGVVMKACHKETGQIVAIKKFKESDEDEQVRKTSLREVRVLKQLRHDNVITLLEVFRRKGRLHLVFEYVEKTILEVLETRANGLTEMEVKKYMYQLLRGVEYCHAHNIIHRDVKPENILISKNGALKLCDFGFARTMSIGGKYTDYVATRWYRSPELLVGDVEYGKGVDVWAIGCIFTEISNGQPLFPGESDVDQLAHIMRCFGRLTNRQVQIFRRNPLYVGVELPNPTITEPLDARFPAVPAPWIGFLKACLKNDPDQRESCGSLMSMPYFTDKNFRNEYEHELKVLFEKEARQNGIKRQEKESSHSNTQSPTPHDNSQPLATKQALPHTNTVSQNNNPYNSMPQQTAQPPLGTMWSQYLQSASNELPNLTQHQHGGGAQQHQPGAYHGGSGQHTPTSMYPSVSGASNPYSTGSHSNKPGPLGGGSSLFPKTKTSHSHNPGSHHAYTSSYSNQESMLVTGGGGSKKKSSSQGSSGSSHLFPTLNNSQPQHHTTSMPQSQYGSSGGGGGGGSLSSQLNYKKKPQKRNVLSTLSLTAFGGMQQSGATGVNPYGTGGGFEVTGSGSTGGGHGGGSMFQGDGGMRRSSNSNKWGN